MPELYLMISVIVPVHNEAGILVSNMQRLKQHLEGLGTEYEIIIAEDGSTDDSAVAAKTMVSDRMILMSSREKLGRGLALKKAIQAAKGGIVMYMDADLATDLGHLRELIATIENGADISTGSRLLKDSKVKGRNFLRELSSRGYNSLLRLLFRSRVHDHQCGFKAFRKSSVLPLLDEVKDNHWFWDSELLIRAQRKGLKVEEIPVRWTDRRQSGVKLHTDILYMGLAAIKLRLGK